MNDEFPTQPGGRLGGLNASGLMRLGIRREASVEAPEVPGYELVESLGKGGMGEVFLARQESLGREVALKVLRADLVDTGWLPERFEREARTMAALHHPHIVTVYDAIRAKDGRGVIVMEFIHGGTLRARMAAAPNGLPIEQALLWFRQIADGLGAAHKAGIIHRDVKPENVLIDRTESARVTDFGMAFSDLPEATRFTQTGTSLGTLGYMAPEQFRGGSVDARSDIFSLGAVLYEMLTGQLPQGSFSPARELRPEIPKPVEDAIQMCLRPDPAKRPPTIESLLRIIDAPVIAKPLITRRRLLLAGAAATLIGVDFWMNRRTRLEQQSVSEWKPIEFPPDPQSAALSGGWRRDGNALVSDAQICILPLSVKLPDAWSVRFKFTRLSSSYSVELFFRTANGTGTFSLGAWANGLGGVQIVDGQQIDDSNGFRLWLENGRQYEWTIEYRRGRVAMLVDGKPMMERDISGKSLAVAAPWQWTPGEDSPDLMLASWKSPTRFEALEFKAL